MSQDYKEVSQRCICFCVAIEGSVSDNSRYLEANAGCKHFDAYGGPENIPVSRLSFNAVVYKSPSPLAHSHMTQLC